MMIFYHHHKQEFGEENYKLLTKKGYIHMIILKILKNIKKINYQLNQNFSIK